MRWLIFAMVVVSASAFFNQPPQANTQQPANNNAVGGQRLPDMNMVMQLVRQILMLLLPKLLANPGLMNAIAGNGGAQPPPVQPPQPVPQPQPQPMPQPQPQPMPQPMPQPQPMPHHPPQHMQQPFPHAGGPPMGPPPANDYYHHHRPHHGAGISALGDKFKDMRIVELLQSPAVGLINDRRLSHFIPRGPVPYGWSLPDVAKEHITYGLHMQIRNGNTHPEVHELMSLIGDVPPPMMGR